MILIRSHTVSYGLILLKLHRINSVSFKDTFGMENSTGPETHCKSA